MTVAESVAREVAQFYSQLAQVESVVQSGSGAFGNSDALSDLDLYVYTKETIPKNIRENFIRSRSVRCEIDNRFFETGDEWTEPNSHTAVDVMFRSPQWLEEQISRVLVQHVASVGYSTCFWHNVLHSQILFDRNSWYQNVQKRAAQPYPEELRKAIVKKNHPILRSNQSSYLHQIEIALNRKDLVSVNHRIAAVLASYFDILFAINRIPHPGEKRQIKVAEELCDVRPQQLRENVEGLIRAIGNAKDSVPNRVNSLVDKLDEILIQEHLIPV